MAEGSYTEEDYVRDKPMLDAACHKKTGKNLTEVDGEEGMDCLACLDEDGSEIAFDELTISSPPKGSPPKGSPPKGSPPKGSPPKGSPPKGESLESLQAKFLADFQENLDENLEPFTDELYKGVDAAFKDHLRETTMKEFEKIKRKIVDAKDPKDKIFNVEKLSVKYQNIFAATTDTLLRERRALRKDSSSSSSSSSEGGTRRSFRKKKRKTKRKNSFWFF